MGWEGRGGFQEAGDIGMPVADSVDVLQKPTRHRKAVVLQLKKEKEKVPVSKSQFKNLDECAKHHKQSIFFTESYTGN